MIRSVSALLLSLLLALPAAARDLKIATLAPDGSPWMNAMREAAKAVEAGSEGQVRFKFYPAGVMGSDATVLRKIKLGQLQGAALTGSEASLVDRNAQLYSLPFLLHDQDELAVLRAALDANLAERMAAGGLRVLGTVEVGFAYLMSTRAVASTEDLRAAKVWVPQNDRVAETTFRSGGVTPVSLPLGDVFTSLQTGLVDTVANTWSGAIGLQWHTRLSHAVDLPLTMVMGYVLLDAKVFERLDPAHQALVERSFADAVARTGERFRRDNADAREVLLQQGLTLLPLSQNDAAQWREVGARATDELVAQGLIDAGLLAEARAILQRHRDGAAPPE